MNSEINQELNIENTWEFDHDMAIKLKLALLVEHLQSQWTWLITQKYPSIVTIFFTIKNAIALLVICVIITRGSSSTDSVTCYGWSTIGLACKHATHQLCHRKEQF